MKANPLEYTAKVVEVGTGGDIQSNPTNSFESNIPIRDRNDNFINDKRTEVEIETKIQTLSSQHQGSYFYIHFQLKLVDSGQEMYVKRKVVVE